MRQTPIAPARLALFAGALAAALGLAWLARSAAPDAPDLRDAPPPSAQAPLPGPDWAVGETFTVRYTIPEAIRGQEEGNRLRGAPRLLDVEHVIVADRIEDGRRQLVVEARAPDGAEALRLTIDAETRALVEVLEVFGPEREAVIANPFAAEGPEALLFTPRRFADRIVERPAIPADLAPGAVETRDIALDPAWYPAFRQELRVDAEGVLSASLSREDLATGELQLLTQRWAPGALWWSEAEAYLGTELLISARLLPPAEGQVFLPALAKDAELGVD